MNSKKNLRVVLEGELKDKWEELTSRKRITQQDAIEALVTFLLNQDDVAQSLILGQVQASPELLGLVYDRLGHVPGRPVRKAARDRQ